MWAIFEIIAPSNNRALGVLTETNNSLPLLFAKYGKPSRYVPPQRVWFLELFGLKTGIYLAFFGLVLGMGFEETTGAYGGK